MLAGAALQHGPWRSYAGLSRACAASERFLSHAGFDRGPWLAVAFAVGIASWFMLGNAWQWAAALAGMAGLSLAAAGGLRRDGAYPYLRQSLVVLPLMIAAGLVGVWCKSALVGVPAIERPVVATLTGTVLSREERVAEGRVRLVLATHSPSDGRAIRVRINLDRKHDRPGLAETSRIRVKARLMPPAPPLLPGGYDFARTAWFKGLAATGSALGPVEIVEGARGGPGLGGLQAALSRHVRENLAGSSGAIAATLASGDRGAIAPADDQAMRDAGLAHLLSISGLHVSAVVGAAYVLALRLLALWPWLTLRVRLPLVAAASGALAGIAYTLVTGAEVPTVRSCIAALLVLGALALGRQPLSMRMITVAALFVMLFWPEAVVGPSFQMSFSAVIAIVALHQAAPIRAFLAPREESLLRRGGRHVAMLFLTGVVIECALMPIGLYHFHRAGVYGSLANLVAIPLTTLVTMPFIAIALVLDLVGAGAPAWWLTGQSLDLLLAMAHFIASRPGAVTMLPAFGAGGVLLAAFGGLWLALWSGRVRLLGLVPAALGLSWMTLQSPPDLLISGDGRHVGIVENGELVLLRSGKAGFAQETLAELAGMRGEARAIENLPGARCNRDFCTVRLERGRPAREGRVWNLLLSRGKDNVPERALFQACAASDIVISDRWLPSSCRPRWFKADRSTLRQTGGLSVDLEHGGIGTVAEGQGEHGWWRTLAPFRRGKSPGKVSAITARTPQSPQMDGPRDVAATSAVPVRARTSPVIP